MILTNNITLLSARSTGLPSFAKSFISRVETDGGVVEGIGCLVSSVKGLPSADQGRVIFDFHAARVLADSGLIEARDCTITEINNLL